MDEYNQSVRDQQQALDELQGDTIDLSMQNETLRLMLQETDTEYDEIYQNLLNLNNQMAKGELSNGEFLDGINSNLDILNEQLGNAQKEFEEANGSAKDFMKTLSSSSKNVLNGIFDELYKGLQQSTKQLNSGQKTIGDYGKQLRDTTKRVRDFAESIGDATKANELDSILQSGVDGAIEFSDYLTNNYDTLTQIFDDTFSVLPTALDDLGNIQSQYRSTLEGMVQSATSFYQQNEAAAAAMAVNLSGILNQNADDIRASLQSGDQAFIDSLMGNAQAAGAYAQGAASQTQSAISQMADGISTIIMGTLALINSINNDVTGEVEETKGIESTYEYADDQGKKATGTIHVPGFKVHISGSGSSGGSVGKGTTTYYSEDTGQFMTTSGSG